MGDVCALLDSDTVFQGVPLDMILRNVKLMLVAVFILTVAVGTVASSVTSAAGLVAVTAAALLSAGALLTLWNDPAQTLSQTIQAARR